MPSSVRMEKKLQSTSQSQAYTKKRSWSLFGALLPIWSTIVSESQQWNHYIWEVSSVNRWDTPKTAMPASGTVQQKGPNASLWQRLTAHRYFRSWANWTTKFCLITWPLANQLPLLQASDNFFFKENASTTSRRQKILSKSSLNPKVRIFMLQE